MNARITLLPGDGIGPEVTTVARHALEAVAPRHGLALVMDHAPIGGAAIDRTGLPLPPDTLERCRAADAVLLGAIGGPQWTDVPAERRPEQGLLDLRRGLGVFANLRPARPFPALAAYSPLKPERLAGVDLLVVRELTGGIYFGRKTASEDEASDVCSYHRDEIERVVRVAAQMARQRRGRLTLVDKANVLATSRLWRRVTCQLMASEFEDVEFDVELVDAAAMHLLRDPQRFDVIVTENLFGDILTDEASMLVGSLGMLPSASLGVSGPGLYEPVHGSAPDIAGRGIANPFGAVLSAAMLLEHSLGCPAAARCLETAVVGCIEAGQVTADLGGTLDTAAVAEALLQRIETEPMMAAGTRSREPCVQRG